ncbi:nucleoside triphosphate pyrophosphohydrolase family protein [Herbaspirillum frisingense]|uniref:nucleoside triphosphate pyrophosphohydrolase family protein n=1 Tax=Herbaspirillum frisingense TaxID=92645 RepID=UPI0039B0D183
MQNALSLRQYETIASKTDLFAQDPQAIQNLSYGFHGEVGGLLAAVKKQRRETITQTNAEIAEEEIGDALWYLSTLARHSGFDFQQIGVQAIAALQRHLHVSAAKRSDSDLLFSEIDGLLAYQTKEIPEKTAKLLYDLARHTGMLFAVFDESSGKIGTPHPEEQFGELFAHLGLVAASFGLRLEQIAEQNLDKIRSRWRLDDAPYHPLFDEDYLEHEKLLRKFEIEFIERDVRGKKFVVQQLFKVNVGDPLTDNRAKADDYRFHDVFHLAYVAHLGWSPVIRGLLKLKRKSDPSVDENQDGARAMIIEEGIATWIFNYARDKEDFFVKVNEGKLEYGLLKQVHTMVSGFEVDKCPLWQWEKAILSGFEIFRQLQEHRGGIVAVDMNTRTITYRKSERGTS